VLSAQGIGGGVAEAECGQFDVRGLAL